jgi:hypothetical protein
MAETQQDDKKTDSRGDEIDMSAHIPKGTSTAHEVEINQEAKLNDLGEGIHTTSATFGEVVSDEATDAVGLTPELNAERTGTDKRSRSSRGSDDDSEQVIPDPSEVIGERKGLEQDDKAKGNEDK